MQVCRSSPLCGRAQQALQTYCRLRRPADISGHPSADRSGKRGLHNVRERLFRYSLPIAPYRCVSRQGPVAHIRISEVSLGRSRSATKVARAALSWQFRLPFTIRSLTVELRDSPAPMQISKSSKSKSTSKAGSKLLLNSGLRLLLGVLPNIPVRIKQLTVKHQVPLCKPRFLSLCHTQLVCCNNCQQRFGQLVQ